MEKIFLNDQQRQKMKSRRNVMYLDGSNQDSNTRLVDEANMCEQLHSV
jgi:hypothetical protein